MRLLLSLLSVLLWQSGQGIRLRSTTAKLALAARLLLIPLSSTTILLPPPAQAAGIRLFPSAEQSAVDEIANFQRPIAELLDQLKPTLTPNPVGVWVEQQVLRDGPEDAAVVFLNMETYIKPVQSKMSAAAAKLDLPAAADKERLAILPALMKGHILELTEAIKTRKAEPMRKEVQEVQETLSEFLKLASTKVEVDPYIPTRPLSDKELFGPLGCEFWGRKRVLGSNACAPAE